MPRLIDADALIKDIDGDLLDGIAEARAIEKINNAPTIAGWITTWDDKREKYVTHWMPLPEPPKEENE